MEENELNKKAMGGTELLMSRLHEEFPNISELIQIIPSRVRELDKDRKRIYYAHDLASDPEAIHALGNNGWQRFNKLVFVSYWQQAEYQTRFGFPLDHSVVIENSIPLFEDSSIKVKDDKIDLIYFSTPHRGLDILYEVYDEIIQDKIFDDGSIHLNVFSSFELYGWGSRDKQFEPLFDKLRNHKNITYNKSVSNDTIRKELLKSDIFAYPSTWPETSCLCLIESMVAGLSCVHSDLAALPETSGGMTNMYNYTTDREKHKTLFKEKLIDTIKNYDVCWSDRLRMQDYARHKFDQEKAFDKWSDLFQSILVS